MPNCIVTGGSGNDAAAMGVLLLNLKATQPWVEHVVIFHDGGISHHDQDVMKGILPVELITYRFPGNTQNFNEIIKYVYTPTIFCKYECFKLLERFDSVLWTDYDVQFVQNVRELIDFSACGSGIKIMRSQVGHGRCHFSDQIRWEGEQEMSTYCPLDSLSVFTNLFVVSRKLSNYQALYDDCIRYTEQFGQWLTLPEQAIFDIVFHQHQITTEDISGDYAVRPVKGEPAPVNAKILHAISQPKFWNGLEDPVWNAYYAEWLKMGGSAWKPLSPWNLRTLRKKLAVLCSRLKKHL